MEKIDAVTASGLVSTAILASLIRILVVRGDLAPREAIEIYEGALLMLEEQHASADPRNSDIYAAARLVVEGMLKK